MIFGFFCELELSAPKKLWLGCFQKTSKTHASRCVWFSLASWLAGETRGFFVLLLLLCLFDCRVPILSSCFTYLLLLLLLSEELLRCVFFAFLLSRSRALSFLFGFGGEKDTKTKSLIFRRERERDREREIFNKHFSKNIPHSTSLLCELIESYVFLEFKERIFKDGETSTFQT